MEFYESSFKLSFLIRFGHTYMYGDEIRYAYRQNKLRTLFQYNSGNICWIYLPLSPSQMGHFFLIITNFDGFTHNLQINWKRTIVVY